MTENDSVNLTPREEVVVERSARLAQELQTVTPGDEILAARLQNQEDVSVSELKLRHHAEDKSRAKLIADDFEQQFHDRILAAQKKKMRMVN